LDEKWLVAVVGIAVQEHPISSLAEARHGVVMEQNAAMGLAQRDLFDVLKESNRDLWGVDVSRWTAWIVSAERINIVAILPSIPNLTIKVLPKATNRGSRVQHTRVIVNTRFNRDYLDSIRVSFKSKSENTYRIHNPHNISCIGVLITITAISELADIVTSSAFRNATSGEETCEI
jgi:hypothetical protein